MRRIPRARTLFARTRFGSAAASPVCSGIGAQKPALNRAPTPQPALTRSRATSYHPELAEFQRWRRCYSTASLVQTEAGVVEVPLAQTGEGIADCELLRWFVQEGESVEEFQPLCEVQSDKATIEITSRYKGKVSKVNFMPGSVVKVGETLLEMILEGTLSSHESSVPREPSRVLATPAVRGLAKQLGINLEDVPGGGEAGRITKEDVMSFVAAKEGVEEILCGLEAPGAAGDQRTQSETPGKPVESEINAQELVKNLEVARHTVEDEVIPIRGFRRTMVKTMTAAAAVPHFHYMEEVCMDALVKLKLDLQARAGLKLTYLPFLIKALSLTLHKYPILNSTVSPDASEIRCKACHNIGVAMATSGGLAVPNIKQTQNLSVKEIAEEVSRLTKLALDNRLAPENVSDGTITISNFGTIGGKFGSPILNLPEAAILAVGRIQKLPRFDELGNVYPASIMSVTWGADHRVIDGATVANFCNEWKRLVEHPEEWLLYLR